MTVWYHPRIFAARDESSPKNPPIGFCLSLRLPLRPLRPLRLRCFSAPLNPSLPNIYKAYGHKISSSVKMVGYGVDAFILDPGIPGPEAAAISPGCCKLTDTLLHFPIRPERIFGCRNRDLLFCQPPGQERSSPCSRFCQAALYQVAARGSRRNNRAAAAALAWGRWWFRWRWPGLKPAICRFS
jgi:hypothetical protein